MTDGDRLDLSSEPTWWTAKLADAPAKCVKDESWDDLFALARSRRFLADQDREGRRVPSHSIRPDPVETIKLALTSATRLDRAGEIAEFALSHATWSSRRAQTPLDAALADDTKHARRLADSYDAERGALWHMLLAWEAADAGDLGEAGEILTALVNKEPPMLRGLAGDRAAFLLSSIAHVDRYSFVTLQSELLDDNDRLELCQLLRDAGDLDIAVDVASSLSWWPYRQVKELATIAKLQALRRDRPASQATLARALKHSSPVDEESGWIGALTQLGAAMGAIGDHEGALAMFARATDMAESSADGMKLAAIASEQVRIGLHDAARGTINAMTSGTMTVYRTQALETLAVALAEAGDHEGAVSALKDMATGEPEYRRGVRTVAELAAAGGHLDDALDLIDQLDPQSRSIGLASVVCGLARASHTKAAVELALRIDDPAWKARALVDAATSPRGGDEVMPMARDAVLAVDDVGVKASRLAELAAADSPKEQRALYERARSLARTVDDDDDRWRLLGGIAIKQCRSGDQGFRETFAEAREAVLADVQNDPWEDDLWDSRELWRLGTEQAHAGDTAGARETFSLALGAATTHFEEKVLLLRPLTLAGIAMEQHRAANRTAAQETLRMAVDAARTLPADVRAFVVQALAEAQAEFGDDIELVPIALAMAASEADLPTILHISNLLSAGGRADKAREILEPALSQLETIGQRLDASEVLSGLALAQARSGDLDGALRTAGLDLTGEALGEASLAIAEGQTRAGDFAGALDTARRLPRYQSRAAADALCVVAGGLAAHGDDDGSREAFDEAVDSAKSDERPTVAVSTLSRCADAQGRLGHWDWAQQTLTAAVELAYKIEDSDDRAQSLSQMVQAQCRLPDRCKALATAADISHPWFADEALFWITLAEAANAQDLDAAVANVNRITGAWWRAAATAAVAAMKTARGDRDAGSYEVESYKRLSAVPEGDPRTKLREVIVGAAMECGDWATVIAAARSMSSERGMRLSHVANQLADRGAIDAFNDLILDCASYVESAHSVCISLARIHPEQAQSIARAVREWQIEST